MERTIRCKTDHSKNKLTHYEQLCIKRWLAEDWGYGEVLNKLSQQFGKVLNPSTLTYYSHVYKDDIEKIRQEIRAEFESVPISQKHIRQLRREDIFKRYVAQGKLSEAREVLNEAKAEADKSQPAVGNVININNKNENAIELIQDEPKTIERYARLIQSHNLVSRTLGEAGCQPILGIDAQG